MPIDGHRSTYPTTIDDWGSAFVNDQLQRFTAEEFNKIEDALFNLEKSSLRTVVTGDDTLPMSTNLSRPVFFVKTWVAVVSGGDSDTKTGTIPAFTSDELALFGGKPFSDQNVAQLFVRKIKAAHESGGYIAGLSGDIDPTGASQGWIIAPLRDQGQDGAIKVPAGSYIFTLVLTS